MAVFKRLRKEVADLRRIVGTDREQHLLGDYGRINSSGMLAEGKLRSIAKSDKMDAEVRQLIKDTESRLRYEFRSKLKELTALVPEAFTVTSFKSSERPPEQLFKAVNNLTGEFAYGATEEEARKKASE